MGSWQDEGDQGDEENNNSLFGLPLLILPYSLLPIPQFPKQLGYFI